MNAVVLSRRDFREYDQIISLYTEDCGKIELLARGVKKIASKNSSHLEPWAIVDVCFVRGKELDHVTTVANNQIFFHIRRSYSKTLFASWILHCVDLCVKSGVPDPDLYRHLIQTFNDLNSLLDQENIPIVDRFVYGFLVHLGVIPENQNLPHETIRSILHEYAGRTLSDWRVMGK